MRQAHAPEAQGRDTSAAAPSASAPSPSIVEHLSMIARTFMTLALAAACLEAAPKAQAADTVKVKRGEYLAAIMDCGGCRTPGALAGRPDMSARLGGSDVGFQIPDLGTFYPPNLTPHAEAGIGSWDEAGIITALRTGVRPDGRELAPAMPWRSYSAISDEDALALVAYLKSLPAVDRKVPAPVGPSEKPPAPYFTVVVPD
jgi:hypothetical protein